MHQLYYAFPPISGYPGISGVLGYHIEPPNTRLCRGFPGTRPSDASANTRVFALITHPVNYPADYPARYLIILEKLVITSCSSSFILKYMCIMFREKGRFHAVHVLHTLVGFCEDVDACAHGAQCFPSLLVSHFLFKFCVITVWSFRSCSLRIITSRLVTDLLCVVELQQ